MAAARTNEASTVQLLLRRARYHGRQDILGMSALMHAVERRACEAAHLLLPHEAALHNAFGETAFDMARRCCVDLGE